MSSLLHHPYHMLKNVDDDQGSLLHHAASCDLPDVVEYLLKLGLESDTYRQEPNWKNRSYHSAEGF